MMMAPNARPATASASSMVAPRRRPLVTSATNRESPSAETLRRMSMARPSAFCDAPSDGRTAGKSPAKREALKCLAPNSPSCTAARAVRAASSADCADRWASACASAPCTAARNSAMGWLSAASAAATRLSDGILIELLVEQRDTLGGRMGRHAARLLVAGLRGVLVEEAEMDLVRLLGHGAGGGEVVRVVMHLRRVDLVQFRRHHAVVVHHHRDARRVLHRLLEHLRREDRAALQDAHEAESLVVVRRAERGVEVRGHPLGGLRHERRVGDPQGDLDGCLLYTSDAADNKRAE